MTLITNLTIFSIIVAIVIRKGLELGTYSAKSNIFTLVFFTTLIKTNKMQYQTNNKFCLNSIQKRSFSTQTESRIETKSPLKVVYDKSTGLPSFQRISDSNVPVMTLSSLLRF